MVDGELQGTVCSTSTIIDYNADNKNTPTIGCPIDNTSIYILDINLNPLPVNIIGEIYIGGESITRGYLEKPDLTAERFIPDPFSNKSGKRLYRTGDLARYLDNGDIDYIGRTDFQVKIRGFRIELGEIESTLQAQEAIREVIVLAHQRQQGSIS